MESVLAEQWGCCPADWPPKTCLEIASGTGQHAWWLLRHWPGMTWQPTDLPEHLAGMEAWREESDRTRFLKPLPLDVTLPDQWPEGPFDVVFSANSAHIMPLAAVQAMFEGTGRMLSANGWFFLYGPFRFPEQPLCESNQAFERWLREQDPARGIRSLTTLTAFAENAGLKLDRVLPMPANNHLLVWRPQS
jgi:hypothetical protein